MDYIFRFELPGPADMDPKMGKKVTLHCITPHSVTVTVFELDCD